MATDKQGRPDSKANLPPEPHPSGTYDHGDQAVQPPRRWCPAGVSRPAPGQASGTAGDLFGDPGLDISDQLRGGDYRP
jgi:hypothetical protein